MQLVALDSRINVSHENQTELERGTSQHDEESIGDDSHVSEEE